MAHGETLRAVWSTFAAALGGALLGVLSSGAVTYFTKQLERRLGRLVAIRTWRDDLYTFADLLNHAGEQRSWPGPVADYWRPSGSEEQFLRMVDHDSRTQKAGGRNVAWGHITAARRTITFMCARWERDENVTLSDEDVALTKSAFVIVERARLDLGTIDRRFDFKARKARGWRPGASIWSDILAADP